MSDLKDKENQNLVFYLADPVDPSGRPAVRAIAYYGPSREMLRLLVDPETGGAYATFENSAVTQVETRVYKPVSIECFNADGNKWNSTSVSVDTARVLNDADEAIHEFLALPALTLKEAEPLPEDPAVFHATVGPLPELPLPPEEVVTYAHVEGTLESPEPVITTSVTEACEPLRKADLILLQPCSPTTGWPAVKIVAHAPYLMGLQVNPGTGEAWLGEELESLDCAGVDPLHGEFTCSDIYGNTWQSAISYPSLYPSRSFAGKNIVVVLTDTEAKVEEFDHPGRAEDAFTQACQEYGYDPNTEDYNAGRVEFEDGTKIILRLA